MILYICYSCTIISLAFIPKNKLREASIAFLFQQFVSWFLGLLAVELHLLEYPVREFPNVNGTSFLFEFLVYPVISVFFCIYYPKTSTNWKKFIYISAFCTAMTISEVIYEKYTDLINYVHWDWYVSWISLYATLLLLWKFYKWYFKLT
ncbi:CBO0543 family protein [Bacillus sp. JJ1562]|uniref:CBO0543 family protein n=1 Tax=Bacillus sp. JJ1562 TaxID=3122960 RepID=UPI0030031735